MINKDSFSAIKFKTASSKQDFIQVEKLFKAYEKSLDFKLDFQDFEKELTAINEIYAPPFGSVILAFHHTRPVGCIGVRKLTAEIGEIKRMYVLPDFRRKNIGFQLLELIVEKAKDLNYKKVRLDTLENMKSAIKLYRVFEFYEIDPYCYNPLENVLYMEKQINED